MFADDFRLNDCSHDQEIADARRGGGDFRDKWLGISGIEGVTGGVGV
jgi:hypothetical protein